MYLMERKNVLFSNLLIMCRPLRFILSAPRGAPTSSGGNTGLEDLQLFSVYKVVNSVSLGFGPLVQHERLVEDITLGSRINLHLLGKLTVK